MWKHPSPTPSFPPLDAPHDVDVAIIGAGITGLTAAYLLSEAGMSVTILEKETVGSGATGYTTGFLCQVIDTDLADAERVWGSAAARDILRGHRIAIDLIGSIVTKERIECEFVRCPNYVYTSDPSEKIDEEHRVAERLGLSVKLITRPDLGFPAIHVLEVAEQAKLHPLQYVAGLTRALMERGVRIFEHTNVLDVQADAVLYTDQGVIRADHVFFATHIPFEEPLGLFFRKGTYTTHIFELEVSSGSLLEGTYEDRRNPYHYFRVDRFDGITRVIVGGEDHRSNIPVPPKKSEAALERFVQKTFGHLDPKIVDRWSGPILEPSDGLPIIGPYRYENTFYASGFSGNGLTYGTLAAKMFADHVAGRKNPWTSLFDPKRAPSLKGLLVKGRDYAEELWHGGIRNTLERP